ncbi:hypothetical protein IAR55_000715 [Kwoniella newhampshirensis]|uniref:Amidase domain-containing protein n=1 Tax=Kwoniella newhampshirensis TaxID=1651941 RepID=A0AAW0Z3S4_9TREE
MLGFIFLALAALPAFSQASQLAGHENYARDARRSLQRSLKSEKRAASEFSFDPQIITFSVGDKQYLSPTGSAFKSHSISEKWGLNDYKGQTLPVTVIQVDGHVTCDVLGKKVETFSSVDDVWDQSFMSAIILTTNSSFHVASDVAGCVKGWGGSLIIKSGEATSDVADIGLAAVDSGFIPQGPYIAKIGDGITLTQVYRSYRDEAQAFTTAVLATEQNTFVPLSAPVLGLNTLSIPVPSRLYYRDLPNARPLEGRRIATKDLFDLAGLKTGGGSRAYFNTYPPRDATAVSIQRLIDQAHTTGLTTPLDLTRESTSLSTPTDSSSGGSIIDPASVQGVFGLRPTWNAISLQGVIPMQATQDTAGFFARDAVAGAEFAKGWYGDRFNNYTQLPPTLILPNDSWTFPDGFAGTETFETFRQSLISLVQPSDIDGRSFEGFWNSTGTYDAVGGQSAASYMNTTYANLITYYQWHNFGAQWFEDYASQNDGRTPFVDPSPSTRWGWGRNLTEAEFNASSTEKQTWKNLIDSQVLVSDNTSCSSSLVVYPYGLGNTNYRNVYRRAPGVPFGFGYPAQMSGVPQIIVPIGQIPYESTVSNHTEYLPLTVTMFAANGCDYVLWDLAARLQETGIISSVAAGSVPYPDKV